VGWLGSFNDLALHPINGRPIDLSQLESINATLAKLRSQIYTDARLLLFPQRPDRRKT